MRRPGDPVERDRPAQAALADLEAAIAAQDWVPRAAVRLAVIARVQAAELAARRRPWLWLSRGPLSATA